SRTTIGGVVYPKGSWVIELTPAYSMARPSDPSGDTAQYGLQVMHSFTDRFMLQTGVATSEATRDTLRADRLLVQLRYLALDGPVKVAPYVEARPSLAGGAFDMTV